MARLQLANMVAPDGAAEATIAAELVNAVGEATATPLGKSLTLSVLLVPVPPPHATNTAAATAPTIIPVFRLIFIERLAFQSIGHWGGAR
jgi:hypothetical protein